MLDRLLSGILLILFAVDLAIYEGRPWSENEMPLAYVENREAFELVAEYMADYDLSPYLSEEVDWSDGCVIYDGVDVEITLRSLPEYDGPVAQPDEATCEAVRQLFKHAKITSITKYAHAPDFVYFEKHLERPLHDEERDRRYTAKGFVYSTQIGAPPDFSRLELGVGILKPLNDHWYYWYAETPD